MDRLCTFTRDLVRNKNILLPLLLFSSFALMLICPYSSSYAETGYITRDRDDYDGYIAGAANKYQSVANLWGYGARRNNNVNYTGYLSKYPYMCVRKDGTGNSCLYENLTGGHGYQQFMNSLAVQGTDLNGLDYSGSMAYWLQSSFTVPSSWYGHKVIVSWDFEVSTWTQADGYVEDSTLVELNWGSVTVKPVSTMSQTCQDIPSAFVYDGNGTNDFIRFAFDYTNVDASANCTWDFRLTTDTYGTGAYKFLMANFRTNALIYFNYPYIAYDIVPEESSGSIEDIVDDWRVQQEEEFQAIETAATAAGTAASPIMSVFNFTVIDPMNSLWSLWNDNSCVNIPIIASMIHYTQSNQVCTWWSASTRSVTTPVFVTMGTLLLWGFVMSWLRNDGAMLEFSEESDPMSPYVGGIRSKVGFKKKG